MDIVGTNKDIEDGGEVQVERQVGLILYFRIVKVETMEVSTVICKVSGLRT